MKNTMAFVAAGMLLAGAASEPAAVAAKKKKKGCRVQLTERSALRKF